MALEMAERHAQRSCRFATTERQADLLIPTRACGAYFIAAAAYSGWSPIDNVSHRLPRPADSDVPSGRA
jgi:hypothetical protein